MGTMWGVYALHVSRPRRPGRPDCPDRPDRPALVASRRVASRRALENVRGWDPPRRDEGGTVGTIGTVGTTRTRDV